MVDDNNVSTSLLIPQELDFKCFLLGNIVPSQNFNKQPISVVIGIKSYSINYISESIRGFILNGVDDVQYILRGI